MHGKNLEFGNLIPGKFCILEGKFAILREDLLFRWIFWSFSYQNLFKKITFLMKFVTIFQGIFFQPC